MYLHTHWTPMQATELPDRGARKILPGPSLLREHIVRGTES